MLVGYTAVRSGKDGVLVEHVQGVTVESHLVGAVGPHDDPELVLVNSRPGLRGR